MPKADSLPQLDPMRDERVLILTPVGRDAAMTAGFLGEAGLRSQVCVDSDALCHEIERGCGAVFLTGEALTAHTVSQLAGCLREQAPWSDIPLLVLTSGGSESPANADAITALNAVGNITLIERPVRAATLLTSVQSALRARRRQYDARDYLVEQIRVREELKRSEERLRIALDAAQMGAWQLDLATLEIGCTARCKADFGLPPDAEFTYEIFMQCVHHDDRARVDDAVQTAIHQRTSYDCEYRVWWPDGSMHWILANGRAKYDDNGEPYGMVGITADITARKNAEHEREQLLTREQTAREAAETANRLKDEFLATVSHELRTPLMAILGWSSLLRMGQLDPDTVTTAIETIERNAHSQVQLINDLLDVSRITRGQLRLEMRPVQLRAIIEAATDAVRPSADVGALSLHLSFDDLDGTVTGDADRLQQVVWNLLTNAVKFTPQGGRIEVELKRVDDSAQISVRDNGQGIDPQFLPAVFDRFRQADSSSTRSYGGLGLGLSIVSQLVALHGGSVEAYSDGADQGATFVVTLPMTERETDDKPMSVSDHEKHGAVLNGATSLEWKRLDDVRILVVEDEDDTREMLSMLFQKRGAQLRAVESVSAALRVLDVWTPDVLVSDIGLPDEDGYSLIAKIRAREAQHGGHLPAIALTAFAKPEDRECLLEAGFQVYLAKPVEPIELTDVVAQLVKQNMDIGSTR